MAPHVGIIITVSVIVAAGIAAYENPHVREWVEKSREKIAVALHSLGDDIHPRSTRSSRDDPSMREEQGEKAEERRRQMRQEIMEKGRLMEERSKRKKSESEKSDIDEKRSPSFDTLVDGDGKLRSEVTASESQDVAESTAVEPQDMTEGLRPRHVEQPQDHMYQSVDAPLLLRKFDAPQAKAAEPFESQYEREMRNTWNIALPEPSAAPASHASESLIDLTPTTEDFPDPDYSVPSISELEHPLERTEYFSIPPSRTSRTMSEDDQSNLCYPTISQPLTPLEPRPMPDNATEDLPASLSASMAGSGAEVHASDLDSEDDFSEFGDGIRTPASAWTDVGSTVSADD